MFYYDYLDHMVSILWNASLLPIKEQPDQEKQLSSNLLGQHGITNVAAHDTHEMEDRVRATPSHPGPSASGTKTEPELVPKWWCHVKCSHTYYSYLQK